MLVTRPEPDASDTAARLAALDIETLKAPMLSLEVLATGLPEAKGFGAMAVTSANALRALEQRGVVSQYFDLPLYAVGERTARLAERLGFRRVDSAGGGFSDLVRLLEQRAGDGPVFYPAGREVTGDLARALAPGGRMVITTQVYAMRAAEALPEPAAAALASGSLCAALFYSKRSAAIFAELTEGIGRAAKDRLAVICLSETVAGPLVEAHFVRVALADHPSEQSMMGLALSFARNENAQ